jgi:hypothetical protein
MALRYYSQAANIWAQNISDHDKLRQLLRLGEDPSALHIAKMVQRHLKQFLEGGMDHSHLIRALVGIAKGRISPTESMPKDKAERAFVFAYLSVLFLVKGLDKYGHLLIMSAMVLLFAEGFSWPDTAVDEAITLVCEQMKAAHIDSEKYDATARSKAVRLDYFVNLKKKPRSDVRKPVHEFFETVAP